MEDKVYPWRLENQMRTSKIESQNVSIAKFMDIWQKIAEGQRKKKTLKSIMNVDKQGILPEIVKQSRR